MKILMIPTYYGGISWWRFEVPAKYLALAGHQVYCPTLDQLKGHIKDSGGSFGNWLMQEMPNYDVVHIGYSPTTDIAKAALIARDTHNVPLITDIDDNLDKVPPYNPGWGAFHPGGTGAKIAKIQIANSDGVTFSTDVLAQALSYLVTKTPSTVLGNWVDIDSWDYPTPPERKDDQSIRLMVTGGNGRYGDWSIIKEPLEWAMAKYDGTGGKPMLRLFFLGATPDWVEKWMLDKGDPHQNRCFYIHPTMDVNLFNRMIRYVSPDIIISPVQKNDFNKSKSGLKFLEASLTGAAFLCTDYDTYSITPKGTCLRVDNTPTQWKESLAALIEDPALRSQLVEKARDWVLENGQAGTYIPTRVAFYEEVISARRDKCRQSSQVPGPVTESAPEADLSKSAVPSRDLAPQTVT